MNFFPSACRWQYHTRNAPDVWQRPRALKFIACWHLVKNAVKYYLNMSIEADPNFDVSPYLHIFEWLPQSFVIPWLRSFGISPLSPLQASYCSSCFFLGISSPLQKYPLLSCALVWLSSFSLGKGNPDGKREQGEERVSAERGLNRTSVSMAATDTTVSPLCPFSSC